MKHEKNFSLDHNKFIIKTRKEKAFIFVMRFLKFGNYEEIEQDTKLIEHYRYKIDSEMPDEVLVDMLVNFTKEIEKWSQLENKFDYDYEYV